MELLVPGIQVIYFSCFFEAHRYCWRYRHISLSEQHPTKCWNAFWCWIFPHIDFTRTQKHTHIQTHSRIKRELVIFCEFWLFFFDSNGIQIEKLINYVFLVGKLEFGGKIRNCFSCLNERFSWNSIIITTMPVSKYFVWRIYIIYIISLSLLNSVQREHSCWYL